MADAGVESNPLLQDFEFPPYDTIEPRHIHPAIDSLLKKLSDLEELERTVEPTWPKLAEPFEKIVDRWTVVRRIINHLEAVKDTAELRAATDAVQADKVKFDLRLEQSEPIHNAFKALQESLDDRSKKRRKESPDWKMLSDARRRVVEDQIRKRVLNGVALKDGRREEFNEIEQAWSRKPHELSMQGRHEQWMDRHSRVYEDNAKKTRRFVIFKDNVEFIESFDEDNAKPYKQGINGFADMTNEEFMASRNGYKKSSSSRLSGAKSSRYENVTAVPSIMDWRKKGAITPIKDQGQCGMATNSPARNPNQFNNRLTRSFRYQY